MVEPRLRGHLTLDPAGIELFAAMMHLLFAHTRNPSPVGDSRHHQHAWDYIRHFQRAVRVDRLGADAGSATYVLTHPQRVAPVSFRVQLGRPWHQALSVQKGAAWVEVDLRSFDVAAP